MAHNEPPYLDLLCLLSSYQSVNSHNIVYTKIVDVKFCCRVLWDFRDIASLLACLYECTRRAIVLSLVVALAMASLLTKCLKFYV